MWQTDGAWQHRGGEQQQVFDDAKWRHFLYSCSSSTQTHNAHNKSAKSTPAAMYTHAHLSSVVLAFSASVISSCLYSSQQGWPYWQTAGNLGAESEALGWKSKAQTAEQRTRPRVLTRNESFIFLGGGWEAVGLHSGMQMERDDMWRTG